MNTSEEDGAIAKYEKLSTLLVFVVQGLLSGLLSHSINHPYRVVAMLWLSTRCIRRMSSWRESRSLLPCIQESNGISTSAQSPTRHHPTRPRRYPTRLPHH